MADTRDSFFRRLSLRLATYGAARRARAQSAAVVARGEPRTVLVLCYGNIHRSPLAELVLRCGLPRDSAVQVRSAGFHPVAERASPPDYVERVRALTGFDLSLHRSRTVSLADLAWADLILIMDRHNWHAIARLGPAQLGKVAWLGAFLDASSPEIADPYGLEEKRVGEIVDSVTVASQRFLQAIQISSVDERRVAVK